MKILSDNVLSALAVVTSAVVVIASIYLWYLSPDHMWPYVLAITVVCIAWVVRYFDGSRANAERTVAESRRKSEQVILFSALLLANALGIKLMAHWGWSGGFAGAFGERSLGFMMGAIVVALASAIPKQVSSARRLAVLRIAGWSLVLGGTGYALAWLILPLAYANDAALLALLCGTIYGAVRVVWLSMKHRALPPSSG